MRNIVSASSPAIVSTRMRLHFAASSDSWFAASRASNFAYVAAGDRLEVGPEHAAQAELILAMPLHPCVAGAALPISALGLEEQLGGQVGPHQAQDAVASQSHTTFQIRLRPRLRPRPRPLGGIKARISSLECGYQFTPPLCQMRIVGTRGLPCPFDIDQFGKDPLAAIF